MRRIIEGNEPPHLHEISQDAILYERPEKVWPEDKVKELKDRPARQAGADRRAVKKTGVVSINNICPVFRHILLSLRTDIKKEPEDQAVDRC